MVVLLLLVAVVPEVVDDVVVAELVEVEIGNLLPPIVILVAGALPKLSTTDVALELTFTVLIWLADNVPE